MKHSQDKRHQEKHDEVNLFQLLLLVLSVYVLIVFAVETLAPLSEATVAILDRADFAICMVFLADFFIRLWKAPSKLEFLRWGWIDFLSSIPVLPVFQHMRWLGSSVSCACFAPSGRRRIFRTFSSGTGPQTGVVSVVLMAVLVSVFGAIAELSLETASDSNIKTAEDAMWWAFSTITTVSCEKYPVTEEGRIVALVLMAAGVCLFGTIAAYISTLFLGPLQKTEESEVRQMLEELRQLRKQVDSLEAQARTLPQAESESL